MTGNPQLFLLAIRQINLGNPQGAIGPLHQVLAADPNHALAHAYLALCLEDTGKHRAARSSIEAALRLASDVGFVHHAAGGIALLQKSFSEAEAHLTKARQLMPAHAETHRLFAALYGRTRRTRRVLPTLQEALSYEPDNFRIVADIGAHLIQVGRLAEAEQKALEALRIYPESLEAHFLMGHVRLHQRKKSEAREHAMTALAGNATFAPALQLLASIELQTNVLVGAWWRFAVWLGRPRADRPSIPILLGVSALYAPIVMLFIADRTVLAWSAIGCVALCFGGLWLTKVLFQHAIQRNLQKFKLRQGF
jgi:Tfp pilus assembly protein PilF